MKKLLIALTCALPFVLDAQEMPSPNQAGLVKLQNVPVNAYNGVASVSVPLYTIDAGGGQIPISLQYNTGGIRVSEEASTVGLGWNLIAGGSITRVMRGEPDEMSAWSTSLNNLELKRNINWARDGEKDLFYYSYPGGGGKFIFGDSFTTQCDSNYALDLQCDQASDYGNCMSERRRYLNDLPCRYGTLTSYDFKTLPYQDIKIEFTYTDRDESSFVITDAQGVQYVYGEVELVTSNTRNVNTTFKVKEQRIYISTWHLTEIKYPNLPASRNVIFNYQSVTAQELNYSYLQRYQYVEHPLINNGNPIFVKKNMATYESKRDFSEKYLNSIFVKNGSNNVTRVYFDHTTREDRATSLRLEKIRVLNHLSQEVNRIDLNQGYFNSLNSYYQGGKLASCADDEECKRLKLLSVDINGQMIRAFDYTNDKSTNGSYGADMFELPPKNSVYYDHRGYFNGDSDQGSVNFVYSEIPYVQNMCGEGSAAPYCETMQGIDRSYRPYAWACALSKISYPTGAYTEITYGLNVENGGARVDKMENFNENDVSISGTEYDYYNENDPLEAIYYLRAPKIGQYYDINSMSPVLGADLNGLTAGYKEVHAIDLKTGARVETEFHTSDPDDREVNPAIKYRFDWDSGGSGLTNLGTSDGMPYITDNLEYFDRGSAKITRSYDAQGTLVSQQENQYIKATTEDTFENTHVSLIRTHEDGSGDLTVIYGVGTYDILYRPVILTQTKTTNYEEGVVLESTTDYTYHSNYKSMPWSTTTEGPDGTLVKEETIFVKDLNPSSGPYKSMLDKHMIAVPVERVIKRKLPGESGYSTVSASINEFQGSSVITPKRSYQLVTKDPLPPSGTESYDNFYLSIGYVPLMDSRMESHSVAYYDANSYLIEKTQKNGITKSYDYDSYGYVTDSYSESSLETRSSTYEYEPLVGIKKVTDTNGDYVSYEYDDKKRLYITRDKDDNIVKRYRYHTINDDFESSISYSGVQKPGANIQFSSLNSSTMFGESTMSWDFGDGSTTQTDNETVSHSFSTHGYYDVELNISNPEYEEEYNYAETVAIYDLDICGPTTYDVCNYSSIGCTSGSTSSMTFSLQNQLGSTSNAEWYYQYYNGSDWSIWVSAGSGVSQITINGGLFTGGRNEDASYDDLIVKCEIGTEESAVMVVSIQYCEGFGGFE